MIIFVVNLLVFAAEEFDTSDTTRDTAFLLSMPLTFRQVVWGKSLLRSTVDVYGVFLLGPLLWSLYMVHGGGLPALGLALVTFFLVELTAILAAMALFVWTAQVVRYDRLGVGISDRDVRDEDLTLDGDVALLGAVIDELGFDKVSLVGGSAGGCAAIAFSARFPERVDRLLLYGAYADGSAITSPMRSWLCDRFSIRVWSRSEIHGSA